MTDHSDNQKKLCAVRDLQETTATVSVVILDGAGFDEDDFSDIGTATEREDAKQLTEMHHTRESLLRLVDATNYRC